MTGACQQGIVPHAICTADTLSQHTSAPAAKGLLEKRKGKR